MDKKYIKKMFQKNRNEKLKGKKNRLKLHFEVKKSIKIHIKLKLSNHKIHAKKIPLQK